MALNSLFRAFVPLRNYYSLTLTPDRSQNVLDSFPCKCNFAQYRENRPLTVSQVARRWSSIKLD